MIRITLIISLLMLVLIIYGCSDELITMEEGDALLTPKNPSLPHDGRCVSYCARAKIHTWTGSAWVAFDLNGDGKIQSCHQEINGFLVEGKPIYEDQCHKAVNPNGTPVCPEYEGRCIMVKDYAKFGGRVPGPNKGDVACILQHGRDTHKHDH